MNYPNYIFFALFFLLANFANAQSGSNAGNNNAGSGLDEGSFVLLGTDTLVHTSSRGNIDTIILAASVNANLEYLESEGDTVGYKVRFANGDTIQFGLYTYENFDFETSTATGLSLAIQERDLLTGVQTNQSIDYLLATNFDWRNPDGVSPVTDTATLFYSNTPIFSLTSTVGFTETGKASEITLNGAGLGASDQTQTAPTRFYTLGDAQVLDWTHISFRPQVTANGTDFIHNIQFDLPNVGGTNWDEDDILGKLTWFSFDNSGVGAREVGYVGLEQRRNGTENITHSTELTFGTAPFNDFVQERMRIDNTGRVGINTDDPLALLDIRNNASSYLRFSEVGGTQFWNMYIDAGTGDWRLNEETTGVIITVEETGDVGIGDTDPGSKLHIGGGDVFVEGSPNGMILQAPDNGCWRIQVNNAGALTTTSVTCP